MTDNARFIAALLTLLLVAGILHADPATRPTTSPAPRLPASFKLVPATDKKAPQPTWTRVNDTTWEETRPGKRPVRYEQIDVPIDPKDPGIVVTRLPQRDIQVFLPTLDNPDRRMGWRYPPGKEPKDAPPKGDGADWYTLGEMVDPK